MNLFQKFSNWFNPKPIPIIPEPSPPPPPPPEDPTIKVVHIDYSTDVLEKSKIVESYHGQENLQKDLFISLIKESIEYYPGFEKFRFDFMQESKNCGSLPYTTRVKDILIREKDLSFNYDILYKEIDSTLYYGRPNMGTTNRIETIDFTKKQVPFKSFTEVFGLCNWKIGDGVIYSSDYGNSKTKIADLELEVIDDEKQLLYFRVINSYNEHIIKDVYINLDFNYVVGSSTNSLILYNEGAKKRSMKAEQDIIKLEIERLKNLPKLEC